MDNRIFLSTGTQLMFPGMMCVIDGVEGFGSNGVVYHGWYRDRLNDGKKHYVLIKELFPFHPKGLIFRGEDGSVQYEGEGAEVFSLQEKSFRNGNQIHLTLLEKFPHQIGANLNTYPLNNTFYTVLGVSGGRSLEHQLDALEKTPLLVIVKRFLHILDSLEVFHREGYLHLDISPDNILLMGTGEQERAMLIDYNSVLRQQDLFGEAENLYYSVKKGYTAPEVKLHHRYKIGPESDLYALCAVFYRHLTGKPLTETQQLRRTPPELTHCKALEDQPETVTYLVRKMLAKGLAILPEKRYRSVEEMRNELQTLSELIQGVGIHHWALWEDGRKRVRKMVLENPSYSYLQNSLYPLMTLSEQGEYLPVEELTEQILSGKQNSVVLTGGGGMGKTTALLHTVLAQSARYSPNQPAVLYLPLYGFREENGTYLRNRILENLKFRSDTPTFEVARHQLELLLKGKVNSENTEKPILFILLDGYNEIQGDTASLLEEIRELSGWGGVRFLISSRIEIPELTFTAVTLSRLCTADVERELSKRGLLLPESDEMLEALKIPLMLSMFISAAQDGQSQLLVSSEQELLERYYHSLYEKQVASLPQNHPDRWTVEAAMQLVLPMIAYRTGQKQAILTTKELLAVVKSCDRLIRSRITFSAFPQWTGHRREVLADTRQYEEWYGILMHDILWSRMGLLIREGDSYRIFHQNLCDYLSERYLILKKQIAKYQNRKRSLVVTSVILAISLVCGSMLALFPDVAKKSVFVRLYSIEEEEAEHLLDYGIAAYHSHGQLYQIMLNSLSMDGKDLEEQKKKLKNFGTSAAQMWERMAIHKMERLFSGYAVMPWSYQQLETEQYRKLMARPMEAEEMYQTCFSDLQFAQEIGDAGYLDVLLDYLLADADYTAALYQFTCVPHISSMDTDSKFYKVARETVAMCTEMELRRADLLEPVNLQTIANCEQARKNCLQKIKEYEGKYMMLRR